MKVKLRPWTALVAALFLLGGCASTGDSNAQRPSEKHTMPDGTVMKGPTHVHDDSHSHGEEDEPGQAVGPSQAARMVCTGQVVDDVTRIMGLATPAEPMSSWKKPEFTCTFDLDAGPLVLSVHDATDVPDGQQHFRTMQASHADAEPIRGVYSLGLPAYETADGTVAFVKDGKTLEVDASDLTGKLGVQKDMTRAEIAYAVATSVLACWTEHG